MFFASEQEKLASVFAPNPSVKDFFDREGGFRVGIPSRIQEPSSGRIIWGVTNDQEFQEEEEISSAESSVEPIHPSLELAAIRARRAQLGSLIAITFALEGMHAYLRWKLGDSVDAAVFNIPQVIPDYGMNLESRLCAGPVQVRIAEDSKATDRFRRIQNLWLKVDVERKKDPAPAFRLIPNSELAEFHAHLLQSVLSVGILANCFQTRSRSAPLELETVVCQNNFCFRSARLPKHDQPKARRPLPVVGWRGNALAIERDPAPNTDNYCAHPLS
ncbi:hypothetical protein C8R47DRAFT_1190343 [Mycena vitilis]|nr:hypothetical protein C8R47DRAFT_1190343 [Mycena vitilis]